MDFAFSPEQQELRRAVRELAADRSTSGEVLVDVGVQPGEHGG